MMAFSSLCKHEDLRGNSQKKDHMNKVMWSKSREETPKEGSDRQSHIAMQQYPFTGRWQVVCHAFIEYLSCAIILLYLCSGHELALSTPKLHIFWPEARHAKPPSCYIFYAWRGLLEATAHVLGGWLGAVHASI